MSISREQLATSYSVFALTRGLNLVIENQIRQVLKDNDLTLPSFRVLWILYFHPNLSMSQLTYHTQTNISNVFRQLAKLNDDGLVIIKNEGDKRVKKVHLTEEGKDIVQGFIDKHTKNPELPFVHLTEKIPKEDLAKFIEVSSLLCNDLLGTQYSDFVEKASTGILGRTNK